MDITEAFLLSIKDCQELSRALEIVKINSKGNIWLIGGFIYRNIAHQLYNSQKPKVDLDFIIERETESYYLPMEWAKSENRFGNPKFINVITHESIDFVPLENIYSIKRRKLEPLIENYLSGVPLNIQSIAFDVYQNKIIGEAGINAIKNKTVEVNDIYFAKYAAKKKGIKLNQMIKEKAEDLGFKAVYPRQEN
jgi:hypothetical protein